MKRFSSFRLKKKPGDKASPAVGQKNEMPNSEASSASSSDTLKLPSDFRSIRDAIKKPFATLTQKSSAQSLENLALPVIKSGWLSKQGGVVKSWNIRWFILRGTTLFYYANDDESRQLGTVSLNGNRVECLESSEFGKYPFQIVPGGTRSRMTLTHETFQLYASKEEERQAWIEAIKGAMEACGGSPALSHKEIEKVPAVFGQDLEEIMEYDSKTSTRKVPQIIEQCVVFLLKYGLDTEGIFRLPGRNIILKQLKEEFDSGERPVFTMPDMDIHSVASLLKLFLRELPQPLVTFELYDIIITLCTAGVQANPETAVESLSSLLIKLPRHNYNVLQYICHFLYEVSLSASVNKMSVMNLATIFVQSIIRPNCDSPEELMNTLSARTMVVYLFITKWRELFKMEYNNQGDLVQVDTLIDLGAGSQNEKKFKARTSVHQQNLNPKTASTFFDTDTSSNLMQPLTPMATPIPQVPIVEEIDEEGNIYDAPKPITDLALEFDVNMNGKEDKEIYDTPAPRPASNSISLPVSSTLTDPRDTNSMGSSQSADNIAKENWLKLPSTNQKRLSAPALRPMVPPRPNKWRHTNQIGDTTVSSRPKLMTIQSADNRNPSDDIVTELTSDINYVNSQSSIAESVTDSGHHGSESDSMGDGTQSPRGKSIANALCFDVLPLSSLSTLGSSASGSQQSVTSDPQDVKLCEISSSDGSSFSLNDSNQDDMLLGSVRRENYGNDDSLHMSLSCGNKAAARRSRASLMGTPASPSAPDKPRLSVVSTFSDSTGDSGSDRLDSDDLVIQELTEKDINAMTQEELIAHVSSLRTELKVQRKKSKTATSKLNATKEKSTDKIQRLAKQLDKERTATANAVERIIKLQAQLQAYQLKFGELNESVYGNTSFYHG